MNNKNLREKKNRDNEITKSRDDVYSRRKTFENFRPKKTDRYYEIT